MLTFKHLDKMSYIFTKLETMEYQLEWIQNFLQRKDIWQIVEQWSQEARTPDLGL